MTDDTAALAAALAKVQADLPNVERDRTVTVQPKDPKKDPYSYSYVTLANLSDAVLPLLAKHGLAFATMPGVGTDGKMCLRYHLLHESGEALSGEFPLSGEGGIQMVGGRITYARRYCLAALVGVAADEDDESRLADGGPGGTAQRASTPRKPAAAAGGKTAQRASKAPPPPLPGEEQPPEDSGGVVTQAQLAKIHATFGDLGIAGDKPAIYRYLSNVTGRDITSGLQLTKKEAHDVIEKQQADLERPFGDQEGSDA